jgi:conjugal transfer pilus assembly protein TraB
MTRTLICALRLGALLGSVPLQAAEDPGIALPPVPRELLLAANDPPATIRHVSADVRECFLVLAGYGDLASERAYLRTEAITCVREDGGATEVAIDAYATGEDGKVGVRGRVVSKQGKLIAQAMMASFVEGFSKMFSTVPVTTLLPSPPPPDRARPSRTS